MGLSWMVSKEEKYLVKENKKLKAKEPHSKNNTLCRLPGLNVTASYVVPFCHNFAHVLWSLFTTGYSILARRSSLGTNRFPTAAREAVRRSREGGSFLSATVKSTLIDFFV